MALIFVGLIAMWVFGDVIDIDATQAAAIGVAVMLVTGVLTWKDALQGRPGTRWSGSGSSSCWRPSSTSTA